MPGCQDPSFPSSNWNHSQHGLGVGEVWQVHSPTGQLSPVIRETHAPSDSTVIDGVSQYGEVGRHPGKNEPETRLQTEPNALPQDRDKMGTEV